MKKTFIVAYILLSLSFNVTKIQNYVFYVKRWPPWQRALNLNGGLLFLNNIDCLSFVSILCNKSNETDMSAPPGPAGTYLWGGPGCHGAWGRHRRHEHAAVVDAYRAARRSVGVVQLRKHKPANVTERSGQDKHWFRQKPAKWQSNGHSHPHFTDTVLASKFSGFFSIDEGNFQHPVYTEQKLSRLWSWSWARRCTCLHCSVQQCTSHCCWLFTHCYIAIHHTSGLKLSKSQSRSSVYTGHNFWIQIGSRSPSR